MKIRYIAAALAVACAGLFGTSAAAFASDNTNSQMYTETAFCGGAPVTTAPSAGFVNAHADGATVTLNVHVHGVNPGETVYFYAYEGYCNFNAFLGSAVANSNGVANLNGVSFTLANAGDSFFIVGFGTSSETETQEINP